jgi:predicted Zn-dependent peptidase
MNKTIRGFAVLAAAAAAFAQPVKVANKHTDIVFPKLNDVQVPKTERYVLPNGLTVFLLEDHELPRVQASAIIRTGTRNEPAAKTGLADIAASVMRSGGTAARPGDKLDDELDRLAVTVETGMSRASGSASVACLKEDVERAFTILADVLQHPAFPEDKIDLEKEQNRASIARRNDNPMAIHGREMRRLLFGRNSPYARIAEYETIDSIKREDLIAFHKEYYQPENVILGVWGDFETPKMKALIEKTLGAWARGGRPRPPVPPVDPALGQKPGVYFIEKEDVNQSSIGMIRFAGKQNDPDYYASVVMADILGGGFASRMFNRIRTEMGLAYASSANYSAGMDVPGTLSAFVGTKSETTMKAIEAMRAVIASMIAGEVTDEELRLSKESILKGAAFDYASTGQVVNRLMTYEYYGYPPDFLQRFRAGIEKVNKADVLAAARKWLKQEDFLTVVLGKSKDFDQPLAKLGPVINVDITIPQPAGPKLEDATPESAGQGKALLAKAKAAMGGARIDAVRALTVKATMKFATPQGEMAIGQESLISTEGKLVQKLATPQGEIVQGFDGEKGWMQMGGRTQDAPSSANAQFKQAMIRDTLSLLQNYAKPGYSVSLQPPQKLGERELQAVAVTHEPTNTVVTVLVDPATGLIAGRSYQGALMGQAGLVTEEVKEMGESEGVKLPKVIAITLNGKPASTVEASEWKLNPPVEASAFAKPQ